MSVTPRPDVRVAVTGIGVVAPGAIGLEAFRNLLDEGRSGIAGIARFDTTDLAAHRAGVITEFSPKAWIPAMKMRRMNGASRMVVAAAKMAIENAGEVTLETTRTGVSIGTAFGPVETSASYLSEYIEKGAALAPPQLFAESVANAPGSHVAIELGFQGFNFTFTQRECSAMISVMYAAMQIAKGVADSAVTGGVDELNEITVTVLSRLGALAHADGMAGEECRPFDRRRNGMVVGEGSALLLLESAAHVGDRRVLAWLSGFGTGRDTTATISDWGVGDDQVAAAMMRALDDAAIGPGDVSAVFASANGSIRGDRVEARAIRRLFGDRIPPVVAVKSRFGEYAAAGALQLAAAIVAVDSQRLPGTLGFHQPEDGLDLPVSPNGADCELKHVLVNSLSAGGGIVCAVVTRNGID